MRPLAVAQVVRFPKMQLSMQSVAYLVQGHLLYTIMTMRSARPPLFQMVGFRWTSQKQKNMKIVSLITSLILTLISSTVGCLLPCLVTNQMGSVWLRLNRIGPGWLRLAFELICIRLTSHCCPEKICQIGNCIHEEVYLRWVTPVVLPSASCIWNHAPEA